MTRHEDLKDFDRLMYIVKVYMRLLPEAWASVYNVETTYYMGDLTRYIVPLRMAYETEWVDRIRKHDREYETNVLDWVKLLTYQYEVRFPTLKIWMQATKRTTLFPEGNK